jgi:hypothetical protein
MSKSNINIGIPEKDRKKVADGLAHMLADTYTVSTWGKFNGDERALTDQQISLCKRKELQPPEAQDLFLEFTKPIYNQLIPSLQGFYRNY